MASAPASYLAAPRSEKPEPHEQLLVELDLLETEQRALTAAVTRLRLSADNRGSELPVTTTAEDVALLREAKRDAGRARQIVQGLVRRLAANEDNR